MAHALYYPTIEFNDEDALKRSLLLWDRVFRIVPAGYSPSDSSAVREAVTANVVEDLHLDAEEKAKAAHQFLDFYAEREDPRSRLVWPAGFSSESFTRLNPEKIDAKLLPLFEQLARRLTADGFLEIPHELAGGYMFYLAKVVAERRSLELLTDTSDCWTVGTYFAHQGAFTEQVHDDGADAYLANFAVDDLLPETLDGVSIEAILRFREKSHEQRAGFQMELAKLRGEISRCNNKQHARYIVSDFIKKFERAKDDYRESLRFFRKTDVCSIFSVGMPVGLSIVALPADVGADPYSALRIGAGMLLGAVSALAAREMGDKKKTVASYLVDAERLSRTPNWMLSRKFEEFMND